MQLFAAGKSRQQAADILGISVKTVHAQVAAINQALGEPPGFARMTALTPAERSAIGTHANQVRWNKGEKSR